MVLHNLSSGTQLEVSTLVDLVRTRAAAQSDQRAYTFLVDGEAEELSLTYGELDQKARAIAAYLQSEGAEGDRALLLFPPGLDYIAAFLGCLYAGVVAIPAYPPRHNRVPDRIQAIRADAQATLALCTASTLSKIEPLLRQNRDLARLRWLVTDRFEEGMEHQWREPDISEKTLAFLQYTSGSTGRPKGVMVSHGNLLHNERLIDCAFGNPQEGIGQERVGMSWLPPYHDMGLIGGLVQPLYGGFPCILMSPAVFVRRPIRWLQAISRYRVTVTGGPNFAYDLCSRSISSEQKSGLDLSSWVVAFTGAEPIRPGTLDRFSRTFETCGFNPEAFYPCYGMAETTLIVSARSGDSDRHKVIAVDKEALKRNQAVEVFPDGEGMQMLTSCGQTLLDQETMIIHPESHTQCPSGTIGEVWVSGASVAQGYWNRPEETAETFGAYRSDTGEGPYLRTGDLGFKHNGELYITGRLKDLIIIQGRNHYPQDIERTVESSHPGFRPGCSAAFSIDIQGEERVTVLQEVSAHRSQDLDRLVGAIRLAVAKEHEIEVYAVMLVRTGRIPKTSSGKIQRGLCRTQFLEGHLDTVWDWIAGPHVKGADIN